MKKLTLLSIALFCFLSSYCKENSITNILIQGDRDDFVYLEGILKETNSNNIKIVYNEDLSSEGYSSYDNSNRKESISENNVYWDYIVITNTDKFSASWNNKSGKIVAIDTCSNLQNDRRLKKSIKIPLCIAIKNAESTSIFRSSKESVNYLLSCCLYEIITGKTIAGNEFMPDFDKRLEVIYTLQMCASEAIKKPDEASIIDEHWYVDYIQSQWKGKKVVLFGDSITDSYQLTSDNDLYWNILKKMLGIETFCYGINGQEMKHVLGQEKKMTEQIKDDFDAIIIFMGTNDYNSNIPIGDWYLEKLKDTVYNGKPAKRLHRTPIFADSTFKGRINITLSTLKAKYPTKQIILLTPLHRAEAYFGTYNIQPNEYFANQCGHYIDDYVNAIKESSAIWSVPVIDLFSISGLFPNTESNSIFFRYPGVKPDNGFHDLLHPNTIGHIRIAYTIGFQLLALPSSFPELKMEQQ